MLSRILGTMRARICFLPLLSRALELSGLPIIDVQMDFKEQRSNIYEANELAELITSGAGWNNAIPFTVNGYAYIIRLFIGLRSAWRTFPHGSRTRRTS